MEKRVQKWLYDILLSVEEIESYLDSIKGGEQEFVENVMVCRAMERSFEIIGEALNRISNANPQIEITNMSGYIRMRNIIAHGYDVVSHARLWQAANEDIISKA
jgi:uncharacterized protein with HEPN domain